MRDRPKFVSTPTAGMVAAYIEFFVNLCQTDIRQKFVLRRIFLAATLK